MDELITSLVREWVKLVNEDVELAATTFLTDHKPLEDADGRVPCLQRQALHTDRPPSGKERR